MFKEVGMEHVLKETFIQEMEQTYKKLYEKGEAQHFVIEDTGEIIGCASAFIKEDIPHCFYKESPYGFIGDVYVEQPYRKQGHARRLTEDVTDRFSEREIKTIRLLASDNARKLYESMGFKGTDQMILHI